MKKTKLASYRFPAEWEAHKATWIAWPHESSDWPGKLEAVEWAYTEIVRILGRSELVKIIVSNREVRTAAKSYLDRHSISSDIYQFHTCLTDRSWLRDSAPTGVFDQNNNPAWISWRFNGWAKYDNHLRDNLLPSYIAEATDKHLVIPKHRHNKTVVMEGGAYDTDGEGTLLVTEECLLSKQQERNSNWTKHDYEEVFAKYLGIEKIIWLKAGIQGDDTHGHIDDVCRFISPTKVVLVYEDDRAKANHKVLKTNYEILKSSTDAKGRPLEITLLPMPREITFEGETLPASYANFYIANKTILVPTFNDVKDIEALSILASLFPTREVIGVHAVDLVLGLGTLHCLTQQEPHPMLI